MILLDKRRTITDSTTTTTIEINGSKLRGLFLLKFNEITESDDSGAQSSISTTITKDELIKLRDSIDLMVTQYELN